MTVFRAANSINHSIYEHVTSVIRQGGKAVGKAVEYGGHTVWSLFGCALYAVLAFKPLLSLTTATTLLPSARHIDSRHGLPPRYSSSAPINANPTDNPEHLQTHLQSTTLPALQSLLSSPWTNHLSTLRTAYLEPYLVRPLAGLLASSTPDLVSILLLIAILLLSLKVLDYARRIIVFWVGLVVKMLFWGAVLVAAFWVYQVGWEKAGRDLGWFGGFLQGLVEEPPQGRHGRGH